MFVCVYVCVREREESDIEAEREKDLFDEIDNGGETRRVESRRHVW